MHSDEKFQIMANATPVMIWVTDGAGRMRFANRAYEEFFGASAQQVRESDWQRLVHPEDRDAYVRAFLISLRERKPFDARARARRADGSWRWVQSYGAPYFSSSGELLGMVGSMPDITAQVEAEQALRESERRFRNMADNAPVIIWICERDGRCSFVSKGWELHTGQSCEAALDTGWLSAVHPDDQSRVRESFYNAGKEQSAYRAEYRLRARDGSYRFVISAATPRVGDSGEFLGYIGSILDITERKQQEDALKEADERKDVFLAVLAHELRNPLGPIANAAELLCRKAAQSEIRTASHIISRQVLHLTRLVDDLLDIARLANGKIRLHRERLAIQDVIAAAVEGTRAYIDAQGHELDVEQPPTPVYVSADLTRLSQVIVNLLTNAAKYTRPGGHIRLQVLAPSTNVEIRVSDNGIGIPADKLPHVFEMFAQVQPLSSRSESGLGIGLSLAKGIMEMHEGTIEAHSPGSGKGSEFVVRLPRTHEATSGTPVAEPAPQPERKSRSVLVVDDNEDSARSLAMLLQLMGHETHTAYGGASALELARAMHPDVVVLDIGMPGMSGLEVAERLRKEPWEGRLFLIALTGFGQVEDRQRSEQAGFNCHLTKPVDVKELERVLENIQ